MMVVAMERGYRVMNDLQKGGEDAMHLDLHTTRVFFMDLLSDRGTHFTVGKECPTL